MRLRRPAEALLAIWRLTVGASRTRDLCDGLTGHGALSRALHGPPPLLVPAVIMSNRSDAPSR
jgi:hypothetical protein